MKKLFVIFLLFYVATFFGQSRKGMFQLDPTSNQHELYVSLPEVVLDGTDDYNRLVFETNSALAQLQEVYGMILEKGIPISDDKLEAMLATSQKLGGDLQKISKLRTIFKVIIPNPTNERLFELATQLELIDEVEYSCLLSLQPVRPPFDIAPVTPNFEPFQTYLGANPGVNITFAWNLNVTGSGIKIRDVEYGFNKNHEELHQINTFLATGMTINSAASVDFTEHGTATFGTVIGHKGLYGISGLAYGATEMILFPEWQISGYNRVFAVSQAIANSVLGDVIIYEMQTGGQGGQYVPAEFNTLVWDLTAAASASGIIVVAAAGNGAQNLNSTYYQNYMNLGNSGAIIVGAGTSNLSHNRIFYSTFGTRVDVQGWGENLFTTGYGDAQNIGNDFNQYYTNFAGTSSATAMVAGCVVVLQSYHFSLTGGYLTGPQMRTILKDTGVPQGNAASGNIGPLPNIQAAMQAIYDNYALSVATENTIEFTVYPNPVQNQLTLMYGSEVSPEAKVELYNALGQLVYQSTLSQAKEIDCSTLMNGFYFVKVTANGKSTTKKIIKS
jgi:subtilisin family serine protease